MKRVAEAVGYALNGRPLYWKLLELSLESLRRYSPGVPAYVFAFGKPPVDARAFARKYGVSVVSRRLPRDPRLAWGLKWSSVGLVPAESVLFLDVDTYFHAPVEGFFRKYSEKVFYARREIAFGRAERHGPLRIANRLNNAAYARLSRELGSRRPAPVFNGGVTVWNNGWHRRWREKARLFENLSNLMLLQNDRLRVLRNDFFVDEVSAGLCLGTLEGFDWGFIRKTDSPWYSEWKLGLTETKGFVMHVNTAYAKHWAGDERGRADALEIARLGKLERQRFLDVRKLARDR